MIYYFFILFLIPMYIRFKASDELYTHKIFALSLIWFSRILSFFLIYHIGEHFLNKYVIVLLPLLLIYLAFRIYKERVLFTHSYSSFITVEPINSFNISTQTK